MRVLIVITHGEIGGATNFVFFLSKNLKEKNIDVKVGFGGGRYLEEKLKEGNIEYINFKWLKRTHNPLANLFFIFEIKRFLDKEKFDIIHFNSTNALFGAIGAKISKNKPKTVFTLHGLSILDPNYKKNIILKPFYFLIFKFLLNFIDIPVFVSKNNLDFAKKSKLTNKGIVIYNGIPNPYFLLKEEAVDFFEKKLKINLKDKFIIGSIGRLDYQKNYEFLITVFPKILKIYKNSICLIIGDGPEKKKLECLIKKLDLENNIFLIGEIKDANKYLKTFNLFILPSRYEGLSITLIEALFAQIPILASNVGGNKEILGEEYLYELNNENDFLNKFNDIILKNKIPFLKSEFFLDNMINSYLELYKRLCKHPQVL